MLRYISRKTRSHRLCQSWTERRAWNYPRRPYYFAGQLYGSGTVFYAGSGELWRTRGVDPTAHERLVTQTVRHVAKGRLLRGSSRGRLILERDRYPVGESITAYYGHF